MSTRAIVGYKRTDGTIMVLGAGMMDIILKMT